MMPPLVGDTHGNRRWIARAIDMAGWTWNPNIIHVGDLGIWPGGHSTDTWDSTEERLAEDNATMYVAPGNHEGYDQIEALTPREDGSLPFRDHILLAPRGHRTEWWERSILWLGGAGSVDRTWRVRRDAADNEKYERYGSSKRSKSWWPQEALTDEDVERAVAGGQADVTICHDAPIGVRTIEERMRGTHTGLRQPTSRTPRSPAGASQPSSPACSPEILIHGHFHFRVGDIWQAPDTGHERRFILDLHEMTVENGP